MGHPASAKHKNLATIPYQKIKHNTRHILHLPGGQQVITYSWDDSSFQVWDLERGTQFGEKWEDKETGVEVIALSPGGKTVATGSDDGTVRLQDVDTGKVAKTLTGHTKSVRSVSWCPDGGRVVSVSEDETFRVWDVQNGKTILGPINTARFVYVVCYSPDGKIIATGGDDLKIWDANTGELLNSFNGYFTCLAWTTDGKTLIAGGSKIRKFDTATWSATIVSENLVNRLDVILLSPNERILASTSLWDKTAQLWNLETNQLIRTPLCHEDSVNCATFSADGRFLITGCDDGHIYTWDVSAIVKEAGLLSDIVNATPQPAPKMKGARQMPPGFFDDALREANLRTRLSQSHGLHSRPTPAPRQRTLSRFSSFWRRSKQHGETEPDTQPRSHPFSGARNIVSEMLRRRDGSDIQLREVEVPCTAGKPRNYHARKKKPTTSSSLNTRTTQQPSGAAQNTPSSSQLPPPTTTTTSTLLAVAGTTGASDTPSRPHIIGVGWRARFVGWLCCVPIQNADSRH